MRLVAATWLDDTTRRWLRAEGRRAEVPVIEVDPARGAAEYLAAFDAALVASGTATLESALAGAPPVIVYQMSRVTAGLARHLIRTPHIGLPNIVLGFRHYPELVQDRLDPGHLARELVRVLERRASFSALAGELRRRLLEPLPRDGKTSRERTVSLLHPWLGAPRRRPARPTNQLPFDRQQP